jgi:hypothetical protein
MIRWWILGTVMASTSLATAEPMQVTLGAEVGGGTTSLLGTRYGAVEAGVDLAAATWLSPHFGVGARLGWASAQPWDTVMMDGHPISREMPWLVEPQVLARTTPLRVGWAKVGWLASAGIGVASLRVDVGCGGVLHQGECVVPNTTSNAMEASASGGGVLELSHVAMFVGVRASANTGGDVGTGLVANLGATF